MLINLSKCLSNFTKCTAVLVNYLKTMYSHSNQSAVLLYNTFDLLEKNLHKKMSLKNPRNLRKGYENLQPRMPELQFVKTLIFRRTL